MDVRPPRLSWQRRYWYAHVGRDERRVHHWHVSARARAYDPRACRSRLSSCAENRRDCGGGERVTKAATTPLKNIMHGACIARTWPNATHHACLVHSLAARGEAAQTTVWAVRRSSPSVRQARNPSATSRATAWRTQPCTHVSTGELAALCLACTRLQERGERCATGPVLPQKRRLGIVCREEWRCAEAQAAHQQEGAQCEGVHALKVGRANFLKTKRTTPLRRFGAVSVQLLRLQSFQAV